jgi:hypothetical protein
MPSSTTRFGGMQKNSEALVESRDRKMKIGSCQRGRPAWLDRIRVSRLTK